MCDIIKVDNVTKIYGNKVQTHALKGVSLTIPKGSFTCIIGPSGHGKSTLLQLIGGLDRVSSGNIFVGGQDITVANDRALSAIRGAKMGFVFQQFNLLENLTALENVALPMMFANMPQNKNRGLELLAMVGLQDKAHAKPTELSGGQLQRVAIARSLANDPDVLLMDEPTGNLDSQAEAEVMAHIHRIHKSGKTIVMVTHNNDIAQTAQQVLTIRDGRLCL